MNHPLFRPIALFSFLMFGLVACGPPETSPNSNPGKQVTDSTTIPGRANGGKSHPYSERENLINPNHFEFFQDFARNRKLPFNREFLQQNGISRISIAHYNDDDNDFTKEIEINSRILSGQKRIEFDREGKITLLETERFANGKPFVKLAVSYEYDGGGKVSRALVRDHAFDDIKESEVNYSYLSDGRLSEQSDPAGISIFFGYDDTKQHIYQAEVTPSGNSTLRVKGKTGDFPDETCLAMQDEILSLGSAFVPYRKIPGLVRTVIFYEMDGRKIVRKVSMGANGIIAGTVDHTYNEFNNLTSQRFLWEDLQAVFRTEKVFRYGPGNDVSDIIHKKVRLDGDNSTEVWRFGYSVEGFWNRFEVSIRVENGPEMIQEINLISLEKGQTETQPQPRGTPGGTH